MRSELAGLQDKIVILEKAAGDLLNLENAHISTKAETNQNTNNLSKQLYQIEKL